MTGPSRTCLAVCLGLALIAWGASVPAHADGMLVPEERPVAGRIELESVQLRAHVRGRAAEVTVAYVFRNGTKSSVQSDFVFALPAGVEIENPILRHGEHVVAGAFVRGEAARGTWLADMDRLREPTMVRHLGAEVYRARLARLAAGARAHLSFTYEQVAGNPGGMSSLVCPLPPTDQLHVAVELETPLPLGPIYSPTHPIHVERTGDARARIAYEGSSSLETPSLQLFWGVTPSRIGASLLTYWPEDEEAGYYLMLAAPRHDPEAARERRAQSITFVVDISGSMAGARLEGMRAALRAAIGRLGTMDHFNVIAYHSQVAPLWTAPRPATKEARNEALGFIDGLSASRNTNIEGALRRALTSPRPSNKPSVIIFLTDGRPTTGETDPEEILASIQRVNEGARTRIYVLGVGVDVNTVMLDRLALENGGEPMFVPPRDSVEEGLARLFARIRHPVLREITFAAHGMQVHEPVGAPIPDLFEDGELILAGRYKGGGPVELVLSGRDGALEREFHYARTAARRGQGLRGDFPARVWAMRKVAAVMDAIRLGSSRSPDLMLDLVRLCTRFGILTEYTAFLAEEGCSSCSASTGANALRVRKIIDALAPKVVGPAGLAQSKGQAERRGAARPSRHVGIWVATDDGRDIRRVEPRGVRMIGSRTFYWRGARDGWVGVGLDPQRDPDATIERWSPAFYELLGSTTRLENERLAQPGPLRLRAQGRILRIVDPQ